MSFFSKKSTAQVADDTIQEQPTTKIGYFLLFLMVVFVVGISQTIFSDLANLVERPDRPARCVSIIAEQSYLGSMPTCQFTDIDRKLGADVQIAGMQSSLNEVAAFDDEIRVVANELQSLSRDLRKLERDYDLSLQEIQAVETVLFDAETIQQQVLTIRGRQQQLQQQLISLEDEQNRVRHSFAAEREVLTATAATIQAEYESQLSWYKFKVFLLMLVFVLPFFAASTWFYLRLKHRNSPHTIIAAAVMAAAALLFLQVTLLFLYDVLLARWLEVIFTFLLSIPFLRYVLYYGSVILTIAVFGGIVYIIQRRIYNTTRVAHRRLKDNKCPTCSFSIKRTEQFCPSCGTNLQHQCHVCGNLRFTHLPVCSSCGDDKRTASPEQEIEES